MYLRVEILDEKAQNMDIQTGPFDSFCLKNIGFPFGWAGVLAEYRFPPHQKKQTEQGIVFLPMVSEKEEQKQKRICSTKLVLPMKSKMTQIQNF